MQTAGYHGKKACSCPPSEDHTARSEAKRALGIAPESQHLLICCPNSEADLLLSEPHEIIAAEAAKHRLPLVLLRRDNRLPPASFRELFAKGCAIVAWDDVKIAEICIELLADEARRTKMATAYSTE